MAFVELVRPLNLLLLAGSLGACYCLLTQHCSVGTGSVLCWLASIVLTAAGGYVINDVQDITADRINRPNRPLPSGKIQPFRAIQLAYTLFSIALLCSLVHFQFTLLTIFCIFMLVIYAFYIKSLPIIGNMLVASLTALSFASLSLLCKVLPPLWELVLFAALTHFLREQIKCLQDEKGDRQAGYRTLPIVVGICTAKKIAIATSIAITLACLVMALLKNGWLQIAWLLLSGVFSIFAHRLWIVTTAKEFGQLSSALKILMAAGVVLVTGSKFFAQN
ncbi:MAG: geranylgeranylglycerol-phosphate geranylgeranyltransferase [Cytophagales bacterium]|nr:geranylgeranylglycerol-phosphate geranylgeranyltransferase [Bernardetiaceae bacterium]MDW8210883.1 geranylgeranylglycerol-phosphate geranylgeranyltransferase [Cytophagales bacterium]